jgi:hypothetical protein
MCHNFGIGKGGALRVGRNATHPGALVLLPFFLLLTNWLAGLMELSVGLWNLPRQHKQVGGGT